MSIYDTEVVEVVMTADQLAEDGAMRIIRISKRTIDSLDSALRDIRRVIAKSGGKAAVVNKLGANAAEVQSFYNAAKAIVENYSPTSVDDL